MVQGGLSPLNRCEPWIQEIQVNQGMNLSSRAILQYSSLRSVGRCTFTLAHNTKLCMICCREGAETLESRRTTRYRKCNLSAQMMSRPEACPA